MVSFSGRIVQISSGAAPSFVAKCSQMNKDFFVDKNVTWSEIEERIIALYLSYQYLKFNLRAMNRKNLLKLR